jgi:hypothetical protein
MVKKIDPKSLFSKKFQPEAGKKFSNRNQTKKHEEMGAEYYWRYQRKFCAETAYVLRTGLISSPPRRV